MSDDEYTLPSHRRRRIPWGSPRPETAELLVRNQDLGILITDIRALSRQLESRGRASAVNSRSLQEIVFSDLMSQEMRGVAPPQALAPVPEPDDWIPTGGPTVTLVPVLPKTTYKDQDDTKGAEKTDSYLNVLNAVLEYIETKAADTLSPHQARKWTEAIDPTNNNEPTAQEALRLCYYMRSQGYDTYAHIDKKGMINLYVVNPRFVNQSAIYWQQNFTTNASTAAELPRSHTARRNAVVAQEYLGSTRRTPGESEAIRLLRRRLRQAGAAVERELTRVDQSPDALMAAIENQTTIQVQLDTALEGMASEPAAVQEPATEDAVIWPAVEDVIQEPAEETIAMDTT